MKDEEEKRKKKRVGVWGRSKKKRVRMEKGEESKNVRRNHPCNFFCVSSVFSSLKNDVEQKCAEKMRRERSKLSR